MKFKIKNIALILVTVGLLASCESLNNPTSLDPGSVKVKTSTKYEVDLNTNKNKNIIWYKEFDIAGDLTSNWNYDNNGKVESKSVYTYQNAMSHEEKVDYNNDGSVKNSMVFDYYLNSDKKIIKKVVYGDLGVISSVYTYDYDAQGNVVQRKEIDMSKGIELNTDFDYQYNPLGELVKRVTTSSGSLITDSLVYNRSNNEIGIISMDNFGSVSTIIIYYYNSFGNVKSEVETSSDGVVLHKYTYLYTYFN